MITLDIFSDPVCPWCYIGKANLDRALERHADHPLIVAWHPFQLNPDMPREGVDRRGYLERKFGGRANAVRLYAQVSAAADQAGVTIDFEKMPWMPNTLDAHRLIHWAGVEGRQSKVKGALMRAFFRDGRDIGDSATLAAIAGEAGMDATLVARLLATDADLDDVTSRDTQARARRVRAVPTFVLDGAHVIQGAQSAEVWDRIIVDIAAQVSVD